MSKTLHLSLIKDAFDVMVTGEKPEEYRKTTKWLISRLTNKNGTEKQYDLIKFVNGYGSDKPYFICQYCGIVLNTHPFIKEFSNGFKVEVFIGDTIIFCGDIVETGNLKA